MTFVLEIVFSLMFVIYSSGCSNGDGDGAGDIGPGGGGSDTNADTGANAGGDGGMEEVDSGIHGDGGTETTVSSSDGRVRLSIPAGALPDGVFAADISMCTPE